MKRAAAAVMLGALVAAPADAHASAAVAVRQDTAHTAATSDPALGPPLRQLWSRKVGDAVPDLYPDYAIVADGRIFVPTAVDAFTEDIVALDAASGDVLWRRSSRYGIGMAYDGGTLFANAYDHGVQALDPATGAVRWASDVGAESHTSSPVAADGLVVVVHDKDTYALRQADGQVLWSHHTFGSDAYAALTGGRIFLNHFGAQTYELDPASGAELWHHLGPQQGGGLSSIAVADGRVWAPGDDDPFSDGDVLSADGGGIIGHFTGAPPAVTSRVALFGGITPRGGGTRLRAEDPGSRALLWEHDLGAVIGQPLVVDGVGYVPLADDRLVGVDITSGAVLWSGTLPGPGVSAAAGDGRLVVTGGGWVTAFGGTAPEPSVAGGANAPGGPGPPSQASTPGTSRVERRVACSVRRGARNAVVVRCHGGWLPARRATGWLRDRRGRIAARLTGRARHGVCRLAGRPRRALPSARYGVTVVIGWGARRTVVRAPVRLR